MVLADCGARVVLPSTNITITRVLLSRRGLSLYTHHPRRNPSRVEHIRFLQRSVSSRGGYPWCSPFMEISHINCQLGLMFMQSPPLTSPRKHHLSLPMRPVSTPEAYRLRSPSVPLLRHKARRAILPCNPRTSHAALTYLHIRRIYHIPVTWIQPMRATQSCSSSRFILNVLFTCK